MLFDRRMDGERTIWPTVSTDADWASVAADDAQLAAGVEAILRRHGVDGPVQRYATGSLPVYAVGQHDVLKLFGPLETAYWRTEAVTLRVLERRLAIATPQLRAADHLHSWAYVLMTRCHGEPLRSMWASLERSARVAAVAQVGRAMRDLHAIEVGSVDLPDEWLTFIDAQRRSAVQRQEARGLSPAWLVQIEPFLSAVDFRPAPTVLLHTEIMLEHVLAEQSPDGLRCTGLIDFEPAMLGHPEYDLASVGLFVTEGDRELMSILLDAYGRQPDRGHGLARRCMAYALLHRYSNLRWYLERLSPVATTLDELALAWFDSGWATDAERLR